MLHRDQRSLPPAPRRPASWERTCSRSGPEHGHHGFTCRIAAKAAPTKARPIRRPGPASVGASLLAMGSSVAAGGHAHAAGNARATLPARPGGYPTVRPSVHDNVQYAPAGSGRPKSARQPGNGTGGRGRARRRPWLPTDIACCPAPPAPARKAVPRSTESAQRFAAGTSMTSSIAPRSPTMRSSGRYMSSTKVPGTV
jgi:hypothetical protein